MRSGQTLVRMVLGLLLGLSMLAAGCASDKQVIAQAQDVHGQLKPTVINDPQLAQYIQKVGDRIIAAARDMTQQGYHAPDKSKEDSSWMFSNKMQFHVVASDQLNAFTTGGEHMYIYTALLQNCRSEDELAAVMSHEFAHVYCRHVQQGMNRQYAVLGAAAAAGAAGYATSSGDNRMTSAGTYAGAAALLGQFVGLGYTREDERQADAVGFDFYVHAGWNPAEFSDFFKQMIQKGYDKTPQLVSDHPSLASRVEAIDAKVAKLPPSAAQFRKPPVADQAQFKSLQEQAKQDAAAMPKSEAAGKAKQLLAAFPSCVAAVETPTQQRARQQVKAGLDQAPPSKKK